MRKGVAMSALGSLLMLVDYLGRVRMLVEAGVVADGDAGLFAGLPGDADEGYRLLS